MHHIKSDARKHAYADSRNPFGRWNPNRQQSSNQIARAEEGFGRIRSTPQNFTPGSRGNTENGKQALRDFQTDPSATSRQRGVEPGDAEKDLNRVDSPLPYDDAIAEDKAPYEGDRSSSTEVPSREEAESSGYHAQNEGTEKARHHALNLFSHKKKVNVDDNNGKVKEKDKYNFTFWGQFRAVVFGSWINVLLIFSPIGIALHFAHANDIAIFVVNFIAIIPLAGTLSYATEEIALRTGEVLGGLLNATFGNAVELIVSIIALFQNQFLIVQTSLLGSMLSNLLLVLGMAFFLGGINRFEQSFNTTVAQTAASLLFLAVASLIIPTTFEAWAQTGSADRTSSEQAIVTGVPQLSHATAIILLLIYGAYLFFQLKSHVSYYTAPSQKNKTRFTEQQKEGWKQRTGLRKVQAITGRKNTMDMDQPFNIPMGGEEEKEDDDQPETPAISLTVAIITLAASTVLVALNAEFLVDSLNSVTCSSNGISKTFVGLILLPIVGNAAEHFTAVSVAIKDKMDLSIGVAVGSSMQIALLVLPLVVIIGWMAGKGDQMTLYFDGFQLAMLFVAILLVNYLIQDGKSHWLEGLLLMMLYMIIAVAAWFYPTSSEASGCE
ncbi:hypothetical protein LTR64_003030 [Lithohypha guttulata]|uniref:Sodium/calcium exchanger membrane region domain-containing protein n=1 Tax=Lithohypha guttulata TaxID=1690604 RepID=A0AAN7SZX4_9EURO|nr:hypothetical protein LTR51_000747 [Lithohypha guttulata]KAK5085932.1 hypothetical protein LTR05_005222 [Lithohypha guttulata]